jgi:hypothetical protein
VTKEDKLALIDRFSSAYAPIESLVDGLPAEALSFVPPIADAWSTNDHLVHLLDSEAAVYFRIRNAIASPGSAVQPWDEDAWHAALSYNATDGRACLAAAKSLRAVETACLRSLVEADWSDFWLEHKEKGRLELERLVEMYRDHLAYHAPFIKRNRDAWKRSKS